MVDFWDREPKTEEERHRKLQKLSDQLGEMFDAEVSEARVTCPCGRTVSLLTMFNCFECGLYFCKKCAARHFALARPSAAITAALREIVHAAAYAPNRGTLLETIGKHRHLVGMEPT